MDGGRDHMGNQRGAQHMGIDPGPRGQLPMQQSQGLYLVQRRWLDQDQKLQRWWLWHQAELLWDQSGCYGQ